MAEICTIATWLPVDIDRNPSVRSRTGSGSAIIYYGHFREWAMTEASILQVEIPRLLSKGSIWLNYYNGYQIFNVTKDSLNVILAIAYNMKVRR